MQQAICPVCGSTNTSIALETIDYSVSQEAFSIHKCTNCNSGFTFNVPNYQAIAPYYDFKNYVSHTDTNETLFFKIYHLVRRFSLKKKLQWIRKYAKQKAHTLIDVGSGTGSFLGYVKAAGWDAIGIEANEKSRANARAINFVQTYDVPVLFTTEKNSVDVVTMWHVLEHVHDLDGYLKQIYNILTENGLLVIAVPNHTCFDAAFYKKHWAAYDVPRHLYHFAPKSLQFIADTYGFNLIAKKQMWFDSYYVSILSAEHKKSSKIVAVIIAFLSNVKALFSVDKCSSVTYFLEKKKTI